MCVKIEEIILPELEEMRTAHVVSIGTESFCDLNPHYRAGYTSILMNIIFYMLF